ncbi:dnaJ homolog subfamily C member 30 isoform X1 [Lingula anatina]|uniref:DnaJ homolog subfamily C member 30 isoform X1 n=1 Tax=Lingula anatina TaxID=7574 RepID=A0A1S3IC10_LINAN|nr:dnaJ homolog subfamily C member 30 isoform X1 [Lingula anatina]XP_013395395.1 dnaJ homolog subfamily C member 30 isoform X1 [Lingula anatina]XP_013395396.1 dnaJ homolog subfamily C member 30 isoform X1 [Lingula anatina]XP_013395397.1 dnaJ homolog subfamily C member 30 isoform X1 [Lingula anatina]|eukprot:XP_013395394.1 dnaJ homolog subfamily C member 30 isoform X1 [Lingula anatina]
MAIQCQCGQIASSKLLQMKWKTFVSGVWSCPPWRSLSLGVPRCGKDHYSTLGVPRDATPDQVKAAYFKLSKIYHPDLNKSPNAQEKFTEISAAYEVIGSPLQRQEYDKTLRLYTATARPYYRTQAGSRPSSQTGPDWWTGHSQRSRSNNDPHNSNSRYRTAYRPSGNNFKRYGHQYYEPHDIDYDELWRRIQNKRKKTQNGHVRYDEKFKFSRKQQVEDSINQLALPFFSLCFMLFLICATMTLRMVVAKSMDPNKYISVHDLRNTKVGKDIKYVNIGDVRKRKVKE